MTCHLVDMPGGGRAFVCGPTTRCKCGNPAKLLCDWKTPGGKSDTCDAKLCNRCTSKPAPDKDLCPTHAAEWNRRQQEKASANG